jgi:hypothetical protein
MIITRIRRASWTWAPLALVAQSIASTSGAQTQPNDRPITIRTTADVAAKRQALIQYVWGSDGFPGTKMPDVTFGTAGNLDDVPLCPGVQLDADIPSCPTSQPYAYPTNLLRVDRFDVPMEGGHTGHALHYVAASNPSKRLVILHQGHQSTFDDDPYTLWNSSQVHFGMEETLRTLLANGFSVLAMYMPGYALFKDVNDTAGHNTIFNTPVAIGSPMKFFLEPVAASLNWLKSNTDYTQYDMVGLSGGGWTTTVYAAIDPRIQLSIPVAGSIPLYMRKDTEGDEEQLRGDFYAVAGYPDLYVLGAYGSGRAQVQVLNWADSCCFGANRERLNPATYESDIADYSAAIQQTLGSLGSGSFRSVIDEIATEHQISSFALSNLVMGTLSVGTSLLADHSLPTSAGTTIKWTAVASGGVSGWPYKYQFWMFQPSNAQWYMVRDYSADPTLTWTPALPATNYAVQVWARQQGMTARYQGYAAVGLFTITSAPSLTLNVNLTPNFPVVTGTSVTLTANASGGVGPLQYKFWMKDSSDPNNLDWVVVKDYGVSNTLNVRPLRNVSSGYYFQTWVRSAGSTASYDTYWASGALTVNQAQAVQLAGVTADKPLPIAPGTTVTWTAAATGPAPMLYQFWLYRPSTGWVIAQDYSSSPTWVWTPAVRDSYTLQVWVKTTTSTNPNGWDQYWASNFDTLVTAGPIQNAALTFNQSFPLAKNVPLTATATATGGTAPLQFQFWLYNGNTGSWSILRDWSNLATAQWTPTASDVGVREIKVAIRSTGTPDVTWVFSGRFSVMI